MKYKVLLANTSQLVRITVDKYKSWKVWKVEFADGRIAMLFKAGNEWMQRNEDFLESATIKTIGQYIDSLIAQKVLIA
ncbi:hypothetical protein BDD43_4222 [Mucilaginibacter gracilis]|uniref:Uncharacterized protein n=1 Tax=Mucilaginibacter gracilis TaxID=423350 RepID=A0A495J4V4_9SPHI|nr:hypothetical protein [Mucilaginibacter gracilis]RKR84005.1 hypothetical protein BDD43_4222 [Mucilaginibacter gracilis]